METINNDYILKLFNLDNKSIKSIDVHHQFDGVHVHVLLDVQSHRYPVCGTETSRTHSYTNIQFSMDPLVSSTIRLDDISVLNAQKHSMNIIRLLLKV